jgi:uncharacterized circularly permuted ATP-grasp superfamily protein
MLDVLSALEPREIARRERLQTLSLLNQGITFAVYGDRKGTERVFPFDFVPRIVPAAEWERLEAGLLHVLDSGHTLGDQLEALAVLFDDLLKRV